MEVIKKETVTMVFYGDIDIDVVRRNIDMYKRLGYNVEISNVHNSQIEINARKSIIY